MAAQRFRPSSSVRSKRTDLVQVDRLDAQGPLRPDSQSTRWPIRDPFDAIDALDLSQPADFPSGVLVMFTNDEREVLAVLAVHNAPANDLQPVISAIIEVNRPAADGRGGPVRGVVLGIIREATSDPMRPPHTPAEEQRWRLAASELGEHGIELLDVVSIDPDGWSSIALTSGALRYPEDTDRRLRWYELD